MQRKLSFAIGLLLLTTQTSWALATPKAGNPCPDMGRVQIVKSVKYVCTKSGKKLLWKIVAQTAKPPSIPNPPESTKPPSIPNPPVSPSISPMPESLKQTLSNSWDSLIALPQQNSNPKITFYADPKFPSEIKQKLELGINQVLAKFGYLIPNDKPVFIIESTSYEFEMSVLNSNKVLLNDYLQEDENWGRHKDRISRYKQPTYDAGGTYPLRGNTGYVLYFRFHPQHSTSGPWNLVGAHETSHLIQWQLNSAFPQVLPAWWLEGQADQWAHVIGNEKASFQTTDELLKKYEGGFPLPFRAGSVDLSQLEGNAVSRTEFDCPLCTSHLVYTRGKLAMDVLTAKFGTSKVLSFMSKLNPQHLWWQDFKDSFGIEIDQFYKDVETIAQTFGDYYSPGWRSKEYVAE